MRVSLRPLTEIGYLRHHETSGCPWPDVWRCCTLAQSAALALKVQHPAEAKCSTHDSSGGVPNRSSWTIPRADSGGGGGTAWTGDAGGGGGSLRRRFSAGVGSVTRRRKPR